MAFLKVKNRATSTLNGAINDAVGSLDVQPGDGALFPSTFPFHITIDDEILECTNRVTDTLTVTRSAEGTSNAGHSDGATVSLLITAAHFTELQTAMDARQADLDLNNYSILFSGALDSNETGEGTKIPGTAGEETAFGKVYYFKSDAKFWESDRDAVATTIGLLVMAMGTVAADASSTFLKKGVARRDSWNFTVGAPLYVGDNGELTETPTVSDPGDVVRVVGHCYPNADHVFFDPAPHQYPVVPG